MKLEKILFLKGGKKRGRPVPHQGRAYLSFRGRGGKSFHFCKEGKVKLRKEERRKGKIEGNRFGGTSTGYHLILQRSEGVEKGPGNPIWKEKRVHFKGNTYKNETTVGRPLKSSQVSSAFRGERTGGGFITKEKKKYYEEKEPVEKKRGQGQRRYASLPGYFLRDGQIRSRGDYK